MRVDSTTPTYCGPIDYNLVAEQNDYVDYSFIVLNREISEIKLAPLALHEPGIYTELYIAFYFVDFPELQVKQRLQVNVVKCEFDYIRFKQDKFSRTYLLGSAMFSSGLPDFETYPDCGRKPEITLLTAKVQQ